MVMTTNRGWRSRRADDRHPFAGRALTRDDVAEPFPESAPTRARDIEDEAPARLPFGAEPSRARAGRRAS